MLIREFTVCAGGIHILTLYRGKKRVLVFNCTSGRSGDTFLKIMMDVVDAQLKFHGREISPFFDHVIFCTNVTYANGHFKGGELKSLSINLPG